MQILISMLYIETRYRVGQSSNVMYITAVKVSDSNLVGRPSISHSFIGINKINFTPSKKVFPFNSNLKPIEAFLNESNRTYVGISIARGVKIQNTRVLVVNKLIKIDNTNKTATARTNPYSSSSLFVFIIILII